MWYRAIPDKEIWVKAPPGVIKSCGPMENSESCAPANNVEFEINTTHSKKIQMDFVSLVVLIWLPFLEPDVAIFCLMFVLIGIKRVVTTLP